MALSQTLKENCDFREQPRFPQDPVVSKPETGWQARTHTHKHTRPLHTKLSRLHHMGFA